MLFGGLREYAHEIIQLQGLCSQLQLGEGVLWREVCTEQRMLHLRWRFGHFKGLIGLIGPNRAIFIEISDV